MARGMKQFAQVQDGYNDFLRFFAQQKEPTNVAPPLATFHG